MSKRLEGKVAIITGASSGLGRSIAVRYAEEGAQVCCVDMFPGLRNAVDPVTHKADFFHNRVTTGIPTHEWLSACSSGKPHIFVRADITKASEVESAVEECVKTYGRLDIMVNNAGISVESRHVQPLRAHETDEDEFDQTMAINAKGVFLGCKYALRQMLKQSRSVDYYIVNTASVQGLVGYLGTPSYCASKGAVVMLTRQIALDYGRDRIHCNALCPGFLKTAMTQNLQSEPDTLRTINAAHPLGGMGDPDAVARAAVFLASSDARWITGVPLPVDGGYVCQ